MIRERLGQAVTRGKVDVRVNYAKTQESKATILDPDYLDAMASQLSAARKIIPDLAPPSLADVLGASNGAENSQLDPQAWAPMCEQACTQALDELRAAREREGQRLAAMMLDCAADIAHTVDQVQADLRSEEHTSELQSLMRI